jgi:hypothetical protein
VDGRGNHPPDNGSGNRLHHIRADAGLSQNWGKAGEDGNNGHQLGTETLHGSLNRRIFNIGIVVNLALQQPTFQRFMQNTQP